MLNTARYRTDYPGEFVVSESRWAKGKKTQTREWIENPIENHHISGRAACIGSPIDHYLFDYTMLAKHRGGLLGSKRLQTYGTADIADQMRLDFVVENSQDRLDKLKTTNYQVENIVYTTSKLVVANPGEFYLLPHTPLMINMALILYLAAFDGHQEIYMLGYNRDALFGSTDGIKQICNVFNTYAGTKFILVGVQADQHPEFFECPNVSGLEFRPFISQCDV
jgi:hypothetical protein